MPRRPLALGEYGTLYVIGFALVSVAAQLAVRSVEEWANSGANARAEKAEAEMAAAAQGNEPPLPVRAYYNAVEDVALFVAEQVFNLLKLMFAALSGRRARPPFAAPFCCPLSPSRTPQICRVALFDELERWVHPIYCCVHGRAPQARRARGAARKRESGKEALKAGRGGEAP